MYFIMQLKLYHLSIERKKNTSPQLLQIEKIKMKLRTKGDHYSPFFV